MRAKGCSGTSDTVIVVEEATSSGVEGAASGAFSLFGIGVVVTIFLLRRGLTPGAGVCRCDTHI
jgi:hypothetical protein